jgi:hypothetical protein
MDQYTAQHRKLNKMRRLYLKDANKIFDNNPVVIVELVLSQFQSLVSGDLVNSLPIFEYEAHHVIGRVPSGHNVVGNEPLLEIEFRAGASPFSELPHL